MVDFRKKLSSTEKLGIDTIFSSGANDKGISSENGAGITEVNIYELIPYSNNPFKLYEGERLEEMKRSISRHGILQPILVREVEGNSKYEILAGHNRYNVAKILAENDERFLKVPVRILKNIDDVTAEIIVSESNMNQRSLNDLLPSEKAFVIATYYAAEKKQGLRTDLISRVNELLGKEEEIESLTGKNKAALEFNLSPMSIAKYSKINTLDKRLKDNLNDGLFDIDSAYNLSFRTPEEQNIIYLYRKENNSKINRKNSLDIKKLETVTKESLDNIFVKNKKEKENSVDKIVKKYFPDKNKDETVMLLDKILEDYFSKNKDIVQHAEWSKAST